MTQVCILLFANKFVELWLFLYVILIELVRQTRYASVCYCLGTMAISAATR